VLKYTNIFFAIMAILMMVLNKPVAVLLRDLRGLDKEGNILPLRVFLFVIGLSVIVYLILLQFGLIQVKDGKLL
jgi:hypothetical protein